MFPIRLSTPKEEGVLQVSKWLKFQVLLDSDEIASLFEEIAPIYCVNVSAAVNGEDALFSAERFLSLYSTYIDELKQGRVPQDGQFRSLFSSALSNDLSAFYAIALAGEKYLIKPVAPVIQMQMHYFFYSSVDGKFHPMVLSEESIAWGIQFAYPQLYQDPLTRSIGKVADCAKFSNTSTFQKLSKWMRSATMPTPFIADQERTNSQIRIGKKSLNWINIHPQLKQKGIAVYAH